MLAFGGSCYFPLSFLRTTQIEVVPFCVKMDSCPSDKVRHVVVDSGAFIRNAPIQNIGENIYTIPEVISEIRDHATRERLQVLPYILQIREPPTEAIRIVTDFAKRTGDYRSLSAVDIKVMALTYLLEKEAVGVEHIRTIPQKKAEWTTSRQLLEKPTDIAGFYISNQKSQSRTTSQTSTSTNEAKSESAGMTQGCQSQSMDSNDCKSHPAVSQSESLLQEMDELSSGRIDQEPIHTDIVDVTQTMLDSDRKNLQSEVDAEVADKISSAVTRNLKDGEILHSNLIEADDDDSDEFHCDDDDEGDDGDDDDDGGDDGWITPRNIKEVKEKMGGVNLEKAIVPVGCLTTDFSMQNVLLQMGLNVISVDGMLIKQAKSYVLRCFACLKVTSNMSKEFCPHCGNSTLQRVSVSVGEDGRVQYFLSRRKPISTRGTKFSLPMPKGGKHAKNPILCEDQPRPHQREAKKYLQKFNVFDPDYIAGTSPFMINDTTSRAAQLGIRTNKGSWNKRNPNSVKKHYGKRK